MKAKTLLLAGLSAFALASCGMKSYKNEVSKEKFLEKLQEATLKNKMLSSEDYFSFKFKRESESKSVDTYLKNDDELSEEIWKEESSTKMKFDSSKSIYKIEAEGESLHETESTKEVEKVDLTEVYQCDSQCAYVVHVDEKLYEKREISNPSDWVAGVAFGNALGVISGFTSMVELADKFYVDDNVFTYEILFDEESASITKTGKSVYQLIIEDDEIKFFEEEELEIKEVNKRTKDVSKSSAVFEKDDVSLKQVKLDKYLNYND